MNFSLIIFFLLSLLVFLSVNAVMWHFFGNEIHDLWDFFLMIFVFGATEIVVVFGIFGFLSMFSLVPLSIGIAIVFLLSLRFHPLKALRQVRQLLIWRKKEPSLFAIGIIFFPFLLFFSTELFNALLQVPWEYDTLAYHLPILVEWVQSGSLWTVLYAVWGGPLGYYPSHYELLLSFFLFPFGTDLMLSLFNFGIVILLIGVIYKICRALRVGNILSMLAAALVVCMPIFLRQMGTNQVDLFVALTIGLSGYYLLRSFQRKDGMLLFPLLFSLSLLLGTKYLSLMYAIPIVVVFFLLSGNWRKYSSTWWFSSMAILFFLGGMWYIRNFFLTGNPFFPAQLRIGSWLLFEGMDDFSGRIQALSLWNRFTETHEFFVWWKALLKETGWQILLLILSYAILVIEIFWRTFSSRMGRGEGRIYALMLFSLPVYWYLYVIAPYTASMMEHNIRYAMPWLMLSMILVVLVISHFSSFFQRLAMVVLIAVVYGEMFSLFPEIRLGQQPFLELGFIIEHIGLFLFFLAMLAAFLFSMIIWRKWSWSFLPLLLILGIGTSLFLESIIPLRENLRHISWQHKYHFPIFKAYEWLDQNAPKATVATSLSPLYYPLYGPALSRDARYVNVNLCESCDYGAYHRLSLSVRDLPEYPEWKNNLKSFGAEFLLLGYSIREGLEHIRPYEFEWVQEHPESFTKVFETDDATVYEIL